MDRNWIECIDNVCEAKANAERMKRETDALCVLTRAEFVQKAMTHLGFEVTSPIEDKEDCKLVWGYFRWKDNGRVKIEVEVDCANGQIGKYWLVDVNGVRVSPATYLSIYSQNVYKESQMDRKYDESCEMLLLAIKVKMCRICGVEYEDVLQESLR